MPKPALGRGLGSLIPQKKTYTEQVIPEAKSKILDIPTEEIKVNPRQPRHDFSVEELEDLVQSIKTYGILQPLIVSPLNGGYELIAGERRLRASKRAGLEKVPVIVREANEREKLELALIENIQRQNLNAVEEAFAFKALIDEFNLTQEEVAKRVGKSRPVITNTLRLLELSEDILQALRDGKITKTHARTLLAEPDEAKQRLLFEQMLAGGVSVREAETRVTGKQKKTRSVTSGSDPNLRAHEEKLREIFGTKVEIKEKSGKGTVSIHFYSKEDLADILNRLAGL